MNRLARLSSTKDIKHDGDMSDMISPGSVSEEANHEEPDAERRLMFVHSDFLRTETAIS